ncbi:peptidase [Halovibrio salipaludis]|uniref:Peptidase n=1 Tax=Halovibrio salipaludis TaxID=2032626 RepID=A0A2A2F5A8_9GAMM|nr:PepSY-associated TM helix domain-containing protein [Halovibrio salipaludis]PAU79785.1 peptidase [Halovibrio salipaludis]
MVASWRESMRWQHTWVGLVLGALLFAIFWMGSLSVFDKEIDRWMMPATRLEPPESLSLAPALASARKVAPDASRWRLMLPTSRSPQMRLYYPDAGGDLQFVDLEPGTGRPLPPQGTLAGSEFIFPFHFSLHLKAGQLGYWLVGLAGMAMLSLLVSGLVVHRKPIQDLFTFRAHKRLGRANLDLHNLTGVVGLPFHFIMTLSGLVIFVNIYFPDAATLAYDDAADPQGRFIEEGLGRFSRPPAGEPGTLAPLEPMLERARAAWSGEGPAFVRVWHPGDAASYVEMRRSNQNMVRINRDQLYFDGGTGEVLFRFEAMPLMKTQRFISGLHFIQFDHWPLRWLYFGGGLSGCVMIVTGFIFWLQARRKRHAGQGAFRLVEGLTVGSVTGIILATLAFFVANRLLPLEARFAGYERAALEVWVFFLVWLGAFVHGWLQRSDAWRGQCWAIAMLAVAAVALNAVTTGDHLLKTLAEGYWPVAGMDLMLLAGAAVAVWSARRLTQHRAVRLREVEFG